MTDSNQNPPGPAESEAGATSSEQHNHGISINLASDNPQVPAETSSSRSPYQSPMRHHKRTPSRTGGVKETLDAHSSYGSGDDDGSALHRINQYTIKNEIGRGSFGAAHLAVDQFGNEFAVKEFSKSRLRKRAKSNLLKRPQPRRPAQIIQGGLGLPLHRQSSSKDDGVNNALDLIKEEIAIMKKLNHNNLVSLIEVLDDPEEDSLYMVLELCKKGPVMKVGLDEPAEPYDDETCRCWFRDMILGIEYLHHQGIIHRDIKPDNCLVTSDDVLKIVDFGVSEMFEKSSPMATAKSAGSPAFMPPELCVAKHGQVSGRAADIWSMGVTLYCLRYGRIPFERSNMLELYECIRTDELKLQDESDPKFADLIRRLLDKNPETRIAMDDIRVHPWVTKDGEDTLLSVDENCTDIVEPPTEQEMNHAITGNMGNLLVVMKAAQRFKAAMNRKRSGLSAMFDRNSKIVAPPQAIAQGRKGKDIAPGNKNVSATVEAHRAKVANQHGDAGGAAEFQREGPTEQPQKKDGVSQQQQPALVGNPKLHRAATVPTPSSASRRAQINSEEHAKGHAHDPLEDRLFLFIGSDPAKNPGPDQGSSNNDPVVSESPSAVEESIFEEAYRKEMDRIVEARGREASMFMNRRVDHHEDIRRHSNIVDAGMMAVREGLVALQSRGYAAQDAGRDAARNAVEKWNETDWKGGFDAGKEGAKSVASERYKVAAERFGPKAEKATGALADLVQRAQAKAGVASNAEVGEQESADSAAGSSHAPAENSGAASGFLEALQSLKPRRSPTN